MSDEIQRHIIIFRNYAQCTDIFRSTSKGGFSAFADESLKNLNPVISFSPFSPIVSCVVENI